MTGGGTSIISRGINQFRGRFSNADIPTNMTSNPTSDRTMSAIQNTEPLVDIGDDELNNGQQKS